MEWILYHAHVPSDLVLSGTTYLSCVAWYYASFLWVLPLLASSFFHIIRTCFSLPHSTRLRVVFFSFHTLGVAFLFLISLIRSCISLPLLEIVPRCRSHHRFGTTHLTRLLSRHSLQLQVMHTFPLFYTSVPLLFDHQSMFITILPSVHHAMFCIHFYLCTTIHWAAFANYIQSIHYIPLTHFLFHFVSHEPLFASIWPKWTL